MRLPLLYVEWDDHHANGAWCDSVDHTPAKCCSVGWLVKEDKKAISLASSATLDVPNNIGNTQYILKINITKRRIIRRGKAY
jgi:hypothetical protein